MSPEGFIIVQDLPDNEFGGAKMGFRGDSKSTPAMSKRMAEQIVEDLKVYSGYKWKIKSIGNVKFVEDTP